MEIKKMLRADKYLLKSNRYRRITMSAVSRVVRIISFFSIKRTTRDTADMVQHSTL